MEPDYLTRKAIFDHNLSYLSSPVGMFLGYTPGDIYRALSSYDWLSDLENSVDYLGENPEYYDIRKHINLC